MNKKELLVIVPCYNEEFNIVNVIKQLTSYDLNFLIIDDHSKDQTLKILKQHNCNYILNKINLGLSETMRVGMKYALQHKYNFCVQFDGDNQHNAKTIIDMIKKNQNYQFDIINGSRFINNLEHENKNKIFVWGIFRFFLKLKTKQKITDPTCGLRMFNKKFMNYYVNFNKFEVEPSTISFAIKVLNMTYGEVATQINSRKHGTSQFDKKTKAIKYTIVQIFKILFNDIFWKRKIKVLISKKTFI